MTATFTFIALGGWVVVAVLLALLVVQRRNLDRFVDPASEDFGSPSDENARPAVSVLVPARNEERSIRECVNSLLAQTYPQPLQVLVLDDESTDATGSILTQLSAIHPNLILLEGKPLAAGWRGKVWACHQLAEVATGELLLFTDADTVHEPGCVETSVSYLLKQRLDLLSLMPRQSMLTFGERLTVPLLHFFYLTFFPAFMLERGFDPRFAAANGQFLLFRRAAYDAIGGHASIRTSIVDDLDLARRMRADQMTIRTADGRRLVSCRMYRNFQEVIEGFTKNLFPALGGSTPRTVGVAAMLVALFVAPPILLLATREFSWLLATLAGFWLRARTVSRSMESPLMALLHPLSIAASVLLLARSWFTHRRKEGPVWKGRRLPL